MEHPSPWEDLTGQIFLASDECIAHIQTHLRAGRTVREVPRVQRYADRPALRDVLGNRMSMSRAERDRLIYEAYRAYGYSMTAIAAELGVHNATISRIIKAKKHAGYKI
jgi:putative transposase